MSRLQLRTPSFSFVATVLHPVFMTSDYSRDLRYRFDAETGEQTLECGKTIFGYMDVPPVKSAIFSGHQTPFVRTIDHGPWLLFSPLIHVPFGRSRFIDPSMSSLAHSSGLAWSWMLWRSRVSDLTMRIPRGLIQP